MSLTLTRRDLDARGAPWAVVDTAHPDDVGDLWAQVTGTGHPVLWRIGTPERVEGWCCTGPWEVRSEDDVRVGADAEALVSPVLARELARAVEPLGTAASRKALAFVDRWLAGGEVAEQLSEALERLSDVRHGRWVREGETRKVLAMTAAWFATRAALRAGDRLSALDGLGMTRRYFDRIPAADRPEARAVILRALGVRL